MKKPFLTLLQTLHPGEQVRDGMSQFGKQTIFPASGLNVLAKAVPQTAKVEKDLVRPVALAPGSGGSEFLLELMHHAQETTLFKLSSRRDALSLFSAQRIDLLQFFDGMN